MNSQLLTYFFRLLSVSAGAAVMIGCDAGGGYEQGAVSTQSPDPVVVDFPIAYVARPIPRDEDGNILSDNVLDPAEFKPGARLVMKDRAAVQAAETVLTDNLFSLPSDDEDTDAMAMGPLYDVKDLSVSRDGLKLLFSLRAPEDENAGDDEQPTWNIWEYDRETESLRRIITSDLVAEAGHDISPKYLANGDIVFSSTRQPRAKAILLDENKPQFDPGTEDDRDEATFALHTMEADGSQISQITFNQSHDLFPEVLDSGDIVFLRWNNYVGGVDATSLYRANPDGTDVGPYYGYHSQNTGTDSSPALLARHVQAPDGRILSTLRMRDATSLGGDIVLVDGANYTDENELIAGATPVGNAQESVSFGTVNTDDTASPRGYYSSAYPLYDDTNRIIASWADCLVLGVGLGAYVHADGTLVDGMGEAVNEDGDKLPQDAEAIIPDEADIRFVPCTRDILILDELSTPTPLYGIWTFDPASNTQVPVVLAEDDTMYTEAVVMEVRPTPSFESPSTPDEATQALINDNLGVVHIRSVYDLDGIDNTLNGIDAIADPLQTAVDERPARFVRIVKAVSLPNDDVYDFDNSAFGRAGRQMKDIIGYVPIEPDGSVKFQVPADVAFTFSILDANGRRVPNYLGDRHANWLTVRPGEVKNCIGCHTRGDETPHGRSDAEPASSWPGADGGTPFPNTVLLDNSEPPLAQLPPETGETMAEYYARINGVREPTINIEFEDEWSNEVIVDKADSFDLSYADMVSTGSPASSACQNNWTGLCRTVINYIDHIQPIWQANRQIFNQFDPDLLISDRTCTSCHSGQDENGQAQVPAGQLELGADQSQERDDYLVSYAELFFQDVPQVVIDGVLQDELEQARDADGNVLFVTDDEGNFVLDEDGNPIPILVTVAPRGAYLSPAGARNNPRFFGLFSPGSSHEDFLNPAELRLISEWLDIGGQYYNNPFDAPEN